MLGTLIAAVAFSQSLQFQMYSKDVWPILTKLGFDAKAAFPQHPDSGTITVGGKTASVVMQMRQSERRNRDLYVSAVSFSYSYRPGKKVSPWFVKGWQEDHGLEEGIPTLVAVGLDGSLRVKTSLLFEFGQPEPMLKSLINGYFTTIERLQRDLPEAPAGAPAFVLDENQKVDALDSVDAGFLIDHWGWTYRHGSGGSSPTWVRPLWIDGMLFFMAPPHPGRLVRDQLFVSARYKPAKDSGLEGQAKELEKKLPDMVITNYGSMLGIGKRIDMTGGITLKKLKSELVDIAKRAAPYVKGNQGLRQDGKPG